MKRIIFSVLGLIFIGNQSFAQGVGIGTTSPDSSALLEIKSTTKGFLPPRMTSAQKAAIKVPKAGLMIYQTDGTKGVYVYNGTAWAAIAGTTSTSSDWSLTGNSGTSATSNFIGTKDNKPLKFRVNNITSGGLDPATGNVALGMYALDSNTNGKQNNAIGYNSLHFNKNGFDNDAVGTASLYFNLDGSGNVAVGTSALNSNENGNENVGLGIHSLQYSTGSGNVAVGANALSKHTGGLNNSGFGYNTNIAVQNLSNATAIGAFAQVDCSNCLVLGSVKGKNGAANNVDLGIGITVPASKLHIKQSGDVYPLNGWGIRMERPLTTDHWELGIDNGNDFDFVFNGSSKAYIRDNDGSYATVSDRRMKKDITTVGSVLPELMKLLPKTYHYNDNKSDAPLSYGFIAQDVEKLFPDFVTTKGADGMKAIVYQNFNVLAIKAIQEQQLVIESQNKRISELEAKMEQVLKSVKR